MRLPTDALELLTAQHEEIDELLAQLPLATGDDRAHLVGALADRLTTHLALEVELFYPHVAEAAAALAVDELVAESVAIRNVLAELLTRADEDRALITELARLVHAHACRQEDGVFERVAERVAEPVLQRLGVVLAERAAASRCIAPPLAA